jgi:flavodoxin
VNGPTLVVYHSSSGNTRKVAEAIAAALGADLEPIRTQKPVDVDIKGKGLDNFLNMGRVVMGGRLGRDVAIKDPLYDPSGYALVVVGTPVYANSLPAPVRAYLSSHRGGFKSLAFFCTGEDPANAHIFELMEKAAGQAPEVRQPFHAPAVREDRFLAHVTTFVSDIQASKA